MSSSVGNASAGSGAGGQGSSGGTGGGGGGGGPCGACKFLRRKCVHGCIFAPYFDAEQGAAQFAMVHKVFGASNTSKLLQQVHPDKRKEAVVTVCFEAQARLRDPVHGCVSHIMALQQQVQSLQNALNNLQNHLAAMELPTPSVFAAQPQMPMTDSFSVTDLPLLSNIPGTVDLSTLFDPQAQSQWAFQQQPLQVPPPPQQQQQLHQQQYVQMGGGSSGAGSSGTGDGGDLQALARELLNRHGRVAGPAPPPPRTHQ